MKQPAPTAPLAILALCSLAAASPAVAGEGLGTDLFGGYSFASIADTSRHGGNLAAGFDLGPLCGFVDAGFHWGSELDVGVRDLTLMAGPGVRFGTRGKTVFFLRGLAGLVRDTASIDVLDVSISETSSAFGVAVGGGVDFRVSGSLALRVQGDYLASDRGADGAASCVPGAPTCDDTGGSSWSSGYRFSAGVVYRFASAR